MTPEKEARLGSGREFYIWIPRQLVHVVKSVQLQRFHVSNDVKRWRWLLGQDGGTFGKDAHV